MKAAMISALLSLLVVNCAPQTNNSELAGNTKKKFKTKASFCTGHLFQEAYFAGFYYKVYCGNEKVATMGHVKFSLNKDKVVASAYPKLEKSLLAAGMVIKRTYNDKQNFIAEKKGQSVVDDNFVGTYYQVLDKHKIVFDDTDMGSISFSKKEQLDAYLDSQNYKNAGLASKRTYIIVRK